MIASTWLGTGAAGTAAHPKGLFVDGLDVMHEPVNGRYGVDIDTIVVNEQGSGGVSSMQFTIDDTALLLTVADGAKVQYWDLTRNVPNFTGWVESITYRGDFGQTGRSIDISCYGIEALLDQVLAPPTAWNNATAFVHGSDTVGSNMWDTAALQSIASMTGLNTGANGITPTMGASTLATPIGGTAPFTAPGVLGTRNATMLGVTVDFSGLSVRNALDAFYRVSSVSGADPDPLQPASFFLSVDFWGGLRYFDFGGGITNFLPTDYAALTITDTVAGALAAVDIEWTRDTSPGAVQNAVYVDGGAAASTGWVVGDTRSGRRETSTSTSAITAGSMYSAANAILATKGAVAGRGSFTLSAYTPTNVHPGSVVTITDARIGFNAQACLVVAIRKTFNSNGSEEWTVTFIDGGGDPVAGQPSAMALTRTLTRSTLN